MLKRFSLAIQLEYASYPTHQLPFITHGCSTCDYSLGYRKGRERRTCWRILFVPLLG
jgi:hypothetical protein